jgi:hypothetical protein
MTNYQDMLTAISGSRWVRILRVLLAVYGWADFCSGALDLPIPVPRDFGAQIETLISGRQIPLPGKLRALEEKNHGDLHAGYCVYGAASSQQHTQKADICRRIKQGDRHGTL